LKPALIALKAAGCRTAYLDGSFVTSKRYPRDYDCCWDPKYVNSSLLESIFLDTSHNGRIKQKLKYGGEFFISTTVTGVRMMKMVEFFQSDQDGRRKGIVQINLEELT
jgi:hypothetical protein